jgi:hypothetical protein
MCQHQLGNVDTAKARLEQGQTWHSLRKSQLTVEQQQELQEFRAEARRLLRLSPLP